MTKKPEQSRVNSPLDMISRIRDHLEAVLLLSSNVLRSNSIFQSFLTSNIQAFPEFASVFDVGIGDSAKRGG